MADPFNALDAYLHPKPYTVCHIPGGGVMQVVDGELRVTMAPATVATVTTKAKGMDKGKDKGGKLPKPPKSAAELAAKQQRKAEKQKRKAALKQTREALAQLGGTGKSAIVQVPVKPANGRVGSKSLAHDDDDRVEVTQRLVWTDRDGWHWV